MLWEICRAIGERPKTVINMPDVEKEFMKAAERKRNERYSEALDQ